MDLVIFDIDGTLIQSHAKEVDCFASAIQDVFGISEINRDLHCYEHITDLGILRECVYKALGRHPTVAESQALEARYFEQFSVSLTDEPIKPIPGSQKLLEKLQSQPNIAVAVATGSHHRAALLKLLHVAPQWCEIPLGSSNDSMVRTMIMKAAHEKSKQAYGIQQFNRIIYIGDGPWDIKATQQLQWHFIGIASNYPKKQLEAWGAKCVIDNYLAPIEFLQVIQDGNLA